METAMTTNLSRTAEMFEVLRKNNKKARPLAEQMRTEANRFTRFSRDEKGLLVDFSRTNIDDASFAALIELAACSGIEAERTRLYQGEEINVTEHRAVLHPVWRERNFNELLQALRYLQALKKLLPGNRSIMLLEQQLKTEKSQKNAQ